MTTVCVKTRYAARAAAHEALDRIDAERPRQRGRKLPVRAYFCSCCRGWHVTSQVKR